MSGAIPQHAIHLQGVQTYNFVFVYLHSNKQRVQFDKQLRKCEVFGAKSAACGNLLLQHTAIHKCSGASENRTGVGTLTPQEGKDEEKEE